MRVTPGLRLVDFFDPLFKPLGFTGHFVFFEEGSEFLVANDGVEFESPMDFSKAGGTKMERGAISFIEMV